MDRRLSGGQLWFFKCYLTGAPPIVSPLLILCDRALELPVPISGPCGHSRIKGIPSFALVKCAAHLLRPLYFKTLDRLLPCAIMLLCSHIALHCTNYCPFWYPCTWRTNHSCNYLVTINYYRTVHWVPPLFSEYAYFCFLYIYQFACYNKNFLYQDYKNNKIQRKSEISDCQT